MTSWEIVMGSKVSYKPLGGWNQGTQFPSRRIGPIVVDSSRVSWYEGNYRPGGPDLEFHVNLTGTTVYVLFIVPHFLEATTLINTTFFLDEEPVRGYLYSPKEGNL